MRNFAKALLVLLPLLAGAAHLRIPVKPVQLSTDKAAHFGCKAACRTSPSPVDSGCVTNCEAEYAQCNDIACQQAVLTKYEKTKGIEPKKEEPKEDKNAKKGGKKEAKKEEKKKEKKKAALIGAVDAPLVAQTTPVKMPLQLSAEEKKAAHFGCTDACRTDSSEPVSSSCVTGCEAAYMQCLDVTCQQNVIIEYKKTKGVAPKAPKKKDDKKGEKGGKKEAKKEEKKKEKKAALIGATPQNGNQPLQLSAEEKKHAHSGCVDACRPSPISSSCVTACEADYFQCIDTACQAQVLTKYAETKGIEKKKEAKKADKGGKKDGKKKEAKKEEKKKK